MPEYEMTDEEMKAVDERVNKKIQEANWWLGDGDKNFPTPKEEEKPEEKPVEKKEDKKDDKTEK